MLGRRCILAVVYNGLRGFLVKNSKFIVVGATGRVGREMLSILLAEGVSSQNILAVASKKSEGKLIYCGTETFSVKLLDEVDFSKFNISLFAAGKDISAVYASRAAAAGCVVIDNSSHFRMDDSVALVVPEINATSIKYAKNRNIIANPNCSTIQLVMSLKPLHDLFEIKELVVSTYQSASGAGQKGVDELLHQTKKVLQNEQIVPQHFKRQLAFNVIPQIDDFVDSGYTKEELKMIRETKKILDLDDIAITATCVRVPTIVGHAVSVFAKFNRKTELSLAKKVLEDFPGIRLMDSPAEYIYATPLDAAKENDVFVSRLRKHQTIDTALSFWCVSDNIRKGAALNAVQIAKIVLQGS
jgi:aspartate-semialdehyde dehydrogenase